MWETLLAVLAQTPVPTSTTEVANPYTIGALAGALLTIVGYIVKKQFEAGDNQDDRLDKMTATALAEKELASKAKDERILALENELRRRDERHIAALAVKDERIKILEEREVQWMKSMQPPQPPTTT